MEDYVDMNHRRLKEVYKEKVNELMGFGRRAIIPAKIIICTLSRQTSRSQLIDGIEALDVELERLEVGS